MCPGKQLSRYRLRFPGLRFSVVLEDPPDRVAGWLAHRWLAEVSRARRVVGTYTLRFHTKTGRKRPAKRRSRSRRPAALRHRLVDSQDVLSVPGGRLLVTPGRSTADLELRSTVHGIGAVLEPLADAALGHALALHGGCFLHAAALQLSRHRLLILGSTGAGKSTLAAAALACGGRVLSDDSLLVGQTGSGRPTLRPLRRDVWLRRDSVEVLPTPLRSCCRRQVLGGEERWRLARRDHPRLFLDRLQPDGLILLRRDLRLRGWRARPLHQAEVLAKLLRVISAVYLVQPRFEREARQLMGLLSGIAQQLPATEVRLGRALLADPSGTMAALVKRLPWS